jgi:hypothetical protein
MEGRQEDLAPQARTLNKLMQRGFALARNGRPSILVLIGSRAPRNRPTGRPTNCSTVLCVTTPRAPRCCASQAEGGQDEKLLHGCLRLVGARMHIPNYSSFTVPPSRFRLKVERCATRHRCCGRF